MESNLIEYHNNTKEKLKQIFPSITDDDLYFREGKEKEMMEMLAHKLGKTKEELINIITTL
jgi:hypothetical protein